MKKFRFKKKMIDIIKTIIVHQTKEKPPDHLLELDTNLRKTAIPTKSLDNSLKKKEKRKNSFNI